MKIMFILITAFGLIIIPLTSSTQPIPKDAFLTRWQSTENYVMEMVASVPDSLLDFSPTDSVFSLREQLTHIHGHVNWIHSYYLSGDSTFSRSGLSDCDKTCLEERLAATFERVRATVRDDMTRQQLMKKHYFRPAGRELSGYELLYLLLDHTKHHMGQMVVYLRLNGIAPPSYTGW